MSLYRTETPEPRKYPTRWHHSVRYIFYYLGLKLGGPPSRPGCRTTPMSFGDWKAWWTRGF